MARAGKVLCMALMVALALALSSNPTAQARGLMLPSKLERILVSTPSPRFGTLPTGSGLGRSYEPSPPRPLLPPSPLLPPFPPFPSKLEGAPAGDGIWTPRSPRSGVLLKGSGSSRRHVLPQPSPRSPRELERAHVGDAYSVPNCPPCGVLPRGQETTSFPHICHNHLHGGGHCSRYHHIKNLD